jgi:hypothetical protein
MSQHDMSIEDGPGLNVRENMNLAIQALVSLSSGPTEPQTIFPGQLWLDTTIQPDGLLRMRNLLNSAWIAPPSAIKGGADMSFGSKLSPDRFVWNDKIDFSGLDIMTLTDAGILRVNGTATARLELNKPVAGGNNNIVRGLSNNSTRWEINLGDSTNESGSNVGSDFSISAYTDAGALLGTALTVKRSTRAVAATTGYAVKAGSAAAPGTSVFNINSTTGAQLWIDGTNLGTITVSSDYRIKKDVAALPSMWDALKSLRPVSYTLADFGDFYKADDIERWGFVAHELQEALIDDAATGHKDAENLIQSPNPWTVLAAAIRTIQECQARIEALEGGAHGTA